MSDSTYREDQQEVKDERRQLRLFDEPRTTYTGRVVYDRKLHTFSTRDILRIIDSTIEYWQLENIPHGILKDRVRLMRDKTAWWLLKKFGIETPAFLKPESPVIEVIVEIGDSFATMLGGWFFKLAGIPEPLAYEAAHRIYNILYDWMMGD